MPLTIGRALVSFIAVFTTFGGFAADFNKTHIFNPLWMPHAIFHTGQTISFGIALGLLSLWYLWVRKDSRGGGGNDSEGAFGNFQTACIFASLYWITQAAAGLYPNTALFDPGMEPGLIFGVIKFSQPRLDALCVSIVAIGYYFEYARVNKNKRIKAI